MTLQRSDAGLQRALLAAQTAEDNRGVDIVVLDMRELTSLFDYFVLATGASRRQLHAMSEEIDHALEDRMGDRRLGIEGYEESRWILARLRRRSGPLIRARNAGLLRPRRSSSGPSQARCRGRNSLWCGRGHRRGLYSSRSEALSFLSFCRGKMRQNAAKCDYARHEVKLV